MPSKVNTTGVPALTKALIRSKILLKLKNQKEEDRRKKSGIIKEKLFKTRFFKKAKIVMFYVSFGGEVKTQDMIKEAKDLGKKVVVPVCQKNRKLRACILGKRSALTRGPYGIFEPKVLKALESEKIDLVIVPGVAFTKKGARLGRGKGYYDRFLETLPKDTPSLGLAFDFQVLPFIPTTKKDISVKKIIFA